MADTLAGHAPKTYLFSWTEVLAALRLPGSKAGARRVRRLVRQFNDRFMGPIVFLGKGSQPFAERSSLIRWWDNLGDEVSLRALAKRHRPDRT
jgi:hypothetical protein